MSELISQQSQEPNPSEPPAPSAASSLDAEKAQHRSFTKARRGQVRIQNDVYLIA